MQQTSHFGKQFINGERVGTGSPTIDSIKAVDYSPTGYQFYQATLEEVNQACLAADQAFDDYSTTSPEIRAHFLDTIADEIDALGDDFIHTVTMETALPEGRIRGERGRVTGQLRLFAEVLRRGDFFGARIDAALPDRKPLPRVDLRQYKVALGPIAVFGASNFPLAFSTAGGDTAAALAAGCPVVFKAHSGHMATAEFIAECIVSAVKKCQMPAGTFNMIYGGRVGADLVKHPKIQGVGFTGSLEGGMALYNLTQNRPQPIPMFAEMSSVNPLVVLPKALEARGDKIAGELLGSYTVGCGQFCTKPGLVIGVKSAAFDAFVNTLVASSKESAPQVMLNKGTLESYNKGIAHLTAEDGFKVIAQGLAPTKVSEAQTHLFQADKKVLLAGSAVLQHEIFGPMTIIVSVDSEAELLDGIKALGGQLTATVIGDDADFVDSTKLIHLLSKKAGRVLFNGYPTGVEVCDAMVHGGPFPATSDARGTSVGTAAIDRFLRPVCFQNAPAAVLPAPIDNKNSLHINRLVKGEITKTA